MKITMKIFFFVGLLALLSIGAFAQDMMSETVQVTTVDVETHPSQGDVRVIDGTSATLVSSESGIWVVCRLMSLKRTISTHSGSLL